jgi:hypothetical protein
MQISSGFVRLALESRRRVKEQQRRVFKSEFRNTYFSYTLGAAWKPLLQRLSCNQKKRSRVVIRCHLVRFGQLHPDWRRPVRVFVELKFRTSQALACASLTNPRAWRSVQPRCE